MGIGQFFAAPGASRRAQGSAGAIGRSAFALAISWPRVAVAIACATVAAAGLLPAASASAEGPCPNEALRSELHSGQLPDCRAYELVTPAYKEGAFISSVFAVSLDGSHMLGASLGAFAGTNEDSLGNGNLLGAKYEFSHIDSGGWVASSLDPLPSDYRSNGLYDASVDLSSTLWELGALGRHGESAQPEKVTDLYLEKPKSAFVEIGPATPEASGINQNRYSYLGGSEDLSHIYFTTSPGFNWPSDTTEGGRSTLYEYIGTHNAEPLLVGVRGSAASTELVSRCGTRLGSSTIEERNGSMYNAVSNDGARTFFTAVGEDDTNCLGGGSPVEPPVDELLVREELSSSSLGPREASTYVLSEPSPSLSYCSEAPSPPCADANFEGASWGGSIVIFTSTQKLLEGATEDSAPSDGAVETSAEVKGCTRTTQPGGCNLYAYSFDSAHRGLLLLSGGEAGAEGARVQGVARISEDGSHVYFVAKGKLTGVPNNQGYTAVDGMDNLYVFERDSRFPEGHTSFVATLSAADDTAGNGYQGDWSRADERPVLTSRNGRYLVFMSRSDLTHENVSPNRPQVFQYDAQTGSLVRASIGQEGYNDDGRTPVEGSRIVNGFPSGYAYSYSDSPTEADGVLAPEDGAVFFESPDALTPHALHDQPDARGSPMPNVYEYNAGSVYLLSDGRDTSTVNTGPGVQLLGSDATGSNVFFTTSDSLIAQDGDTEQDIYDTRVEGGFPTPTSPSSCAGEACRGALGVVTVPPTPGSATQAAEGGPPPTPASASPKPTVKVRSKHPKKRRSRARKTIRPHSPRRKTGR
jgi:hypothetical protein